MYSKGEDQKQTIVEAANRLFYERGYGQTSFTDIAKAADFPRGNFYHYFKSKDDILKAVIEARSQRIAARLAQWDAEIEAPMERLIRFVHILPDEVADVVRFGCPMGTLNTEFAKGVRQNLPLARDMFDTFRTWLEAQFRALGQDDPTALARELLVRTQGAALLAHVYGDAELLAAETRAIEGWLNKLT